jgi:hypothetical protein
VYVTNLEKSKLIANAFSNVYQTHDFNISNTESEAVGTSIDIIRNSVIELTPNVLVSPTEVRNTIRSLRLTITGPDQINNRLLKKFHRKAIVYLTHIMNACFKYSYFPTVWKQACVIPTLKPGRDSSDPKSYRPISLLKALSNILERLLLHRLKTHVAEHRIYLNEQFGLRE